MTANLFAVLLRTDASAFMWLKWRFEAVWNRLIELGAGATVLIALLGCGDSLRAGDDGWLGTVDTLDSGRLLVTNTAFSGDGWELREIFRLGAFDGDSPDMFGDIISVELGFGGELYVLDMQASEVRSFGPEGEYLQTFGRPGQGPGELGYAAGMALGPNGVLWVLNWGKGLFTGFDPTTGRLVNEVRRSGSFASVPWPGQFDRKGRLLDEAFSVDGEPVAVLLDDAFVPQDTIALPRADRSNTIHFRRSGRSVMSFLDPFSPRPVWAAHSSGGIVVGEGGRYRLHRIGVGSDTTLSVDLPWVPVSVSREERDSAVAVFQQIAEGAGGVTPDRRPRIPDVKPAHGPLFTDDKGNTWVQRSARSDELPSWDIIDEGGRWIGTVESPVTPTHVVPSVRGDRAAIVTSVDGVPTVIVFAVVRARGAT